MSLYIERCDEMILLSGVHGVGKGFFVETKLKKWYKGKIFTASDLIKKYKPATDAGYKRVYDVADNQRVLMNAIKQESAIDGDDFILDGHLCIINYKDEIERIPDSFILNMNVKTIILIQDETKKIYERLIKRDGNSISQFIIDNMQFEEKKYSEYLYEKYHIEYIVLSPECTKEEIDKLKERIR